MSALVKANRSRIFNILKPHPLNGIFVASPCMKPKTFLLKELTNMFNAAKSVHSINLSNGGRGRGLNFQQWSDLQKSLGK